MSFQNIKPTKPELDKMKKRRNFAQRGENLLELKRQQLYNALTKTADDYFLLRNKMRAQLIDNLRLLEDTYKANGKQKIIRIANFNTISHKPSVDIKYIHEAGIDLPVIQLNIPENKLPTYSFSDTSLHIDILIKKLRVTLQLLCELAIFDKKMYRIAEEHKKIHRRIDALEDVIIPKLEGGIKAIQEILSDEEREEFIRMKKIKEILDLDEID